MWEISKRAFQAYGEPLETVTLFKYMVRVLTAGDDKWQAMARNLRKARKIWRRMTRILDREGEYLRISGLFLRHLYRWCCFSGQRSGS